MEETKKVILNDTFDAQIWAQEWLKTIKEHPDIPTDEGTMSSWFANALMAGYDYAYREMEAKSEAQQIRRQREKEVTNAKLI